MFYFSRSHLITRICLKSCLFPAAVGTVHVRNLHQSSGLSSNRATVHHRKTSSPIDQLAVDWYPIYRFPYIVHCRIFSRAKIYMTGIMVGVLPIGYLIEAESYRLSDIMWLGGAAGFSLAVLYGFGNLFRRLIGSIYVSPDEKLVRISHLTFFGNRQDKILPTDDIMLLMDANANLDDYFLRVATTGEKPTDSLWICLKFGGILDREKFGKIFGPLN